MSKASEAVALAREMAADNSHGYDQTNRWGPDYDCSSFVITVWERVGVPVKSRGATYTGNMAITFLQAGFKKVDKSNLLPGDVLLNTLHHTALYIGNGRIVQAGSNESGGITGGRTGDQNGYEICETAYYDYPWDYILRYPDGEEALTETQVQTMQAALPLITRALEHEVREDVKAFQALHNHRFESQLEVDGQYGPMTEEACKYVQRAYGLLEDGECGPQTWAALIRGK